MLLIVLVSVFSVVIIALLVGSGFIYKHIKDEAEIASMTWLIRPEDILWPKSGRGPTGSRQSIRVGDQPALVVVTIKLRKERLFHASD